jgi:hypothetical protein
MSPWMGKIRIAMVLAFLCDLSAACIAPTPFEVAIASPGPTEPDRAYYYSTVGQELTYARVREASARTAIQPARSVSQPARKSCDLLVPGPKCAPLGDFCPMSLRTLCPPLPRSALQPVTQDFTVE